MEIVTGAGAFRSPGPGRTARYLEQLRVPAMSVGTYSIAAGGEDGQSPHHEDEIYVVTAGRARFTGGRETVPVGPGDVIFVPAGEPHRFTEITEDLAALVFFAPAESD
jgi:mannose-6-phosphate isomerase-like protein (cupin superfamily)